MRRLRAVACLAAIAVPAILAACGGGEQSPASSSAATGHLFARGIEQISDLYIEPVSNRKLVTVGAMNLSKLDEKLGVTIGGDVRDRDRLVLTYQGGEVAAAQLPAEIGGADGGEIIARLIAAAKQASPKIAAMPEEAIDRAVFDGMTGLLDRFSRYASPEDARDQRAARDGFGGIGVTLETTNDDFRITALAPQGPAERAGIRVGDRITAIDGTSTAGRRPAEIIHQLRGPMASTVVLTVVRTGTPGTHDFKLERALVAVPTVTALRDGNIAVFRIASFNQSTTQRLTESLIEAQRQAGGQLGGIVLDLRGNPGGLLDQAVSLADLFIVKGPIIATVGRHPASHQYFAATGHSIAANVPLVVLVNGGSASASEIVAAALQDVGRAVVIGSSSYGKGTVQTVMRLPNDGELTLTWARLVTPSGYYLQEHGVVPTLCTSGLSDDDRSVDTALARPAAAGTVAVSRPRVSLDEQAWTALRQACPARPGSPGLDVKLAERVLSDPARYSAALGAIHPISAMATPAPVVPGAALTAVTGGLSSPQRSP
jgi:carboxyl-terminal processing protease